MAEPIRIGVLATRGPALARAQWQPLLRWLALRVPGHRFVLHPLGLDELAEAVAREHLDFVITNPGQSVSLARQYPLAWLATLKSPAGGQPRHRRRPGGACPGPHRHWRDLEGQAVAAVRRTPSAATSPIASRQANGVQAGALLLHRAVHRLSAGPAHRAAGGRGGGRRHRAGVSAGAHGAGGQGRQGAFRVLDDQAPAGFGCQSSTRLYPNWSFAKTERASPRWRWR